MPAPIVPAHRRAPVLAVILCAIAVVAVLAGIVFHGTTTGFDNWMFRELYLHIGPRGAQVLLGFTTPAIAYALLTLVLIGAAAVRRWDVAALAVAGPGIALALTEVVLKPLVGRRLGPGAIVGDYSTALPGSFPSGHETGVAATALVLLVICCRLPLRRSTRTVAITLLCAWVLAAAVGLVRNFFHYATDTIGAVAVCVAAVLAVALAIDWATALLGQRAIAAAPDEDDVRSPARTSPAD